MDRNAKIMTAISAESRVLEIGPSYAPILPKSQFKNVFSLDHNSQPELIKKYTSHGVDTSRIEPVDFVWHNGPIHACVPPRLRGTFEAVVASHVLEHIPDPISWMQSFSVLLKPEGVVSLAIPDKRYTFDFLKPLSVSADFIEAYEEKRSRHTRRTLLKQMFDSVKNDGAIAWGPQIPLGAIEYAHSGAMYSPPANQSDAYEDAHAWVFVPSSFDLLILELHRFGLIPFSVDQAFPSEGCEFFRTLKRAPIDTSEFDANRLRLHRSAWDEERPVREAFTSGIPASALP